MTDRIIVNYNPITGEMSIPRTGTVITYVPASEINRAKTKRKPIQLVKYNPLHRPGSNFVTKPNTENEEPQEVVTIATIEEPTTTITKRKPKHTRMRPATDRRAVNQMLAQMRNSNIYPNGIIYTRNVDLSKSYNLTSYLRYVGDYSIDAYNLSATDTQQRFTPSWQIEMRNAIRELEDAKKRLKAGTMYQEDVDALQQKLDQLIARHQSNQGTDYRDQMRADSRRAKRIMRETQNEQLSPEDLYEPKVIEDGTTVDNTCATPDVSPEELQQWVQQIRAQTQVDEQKQRFVDCARSLYYSGK